MTRLSAKDLDAVLEFSLEARTFADLSEFRRGVLGLLRKVVACDLAGYNEVGLARAATVVTEPADATFAGAGERLVALAHQHPLVARARAGDGRTYLISDFLSQREFHRLELYQDIFRLLDMEDQIAFALPGPVIVGIALNRPRRSFTERDRALLERLRPHLWSAYAQVRERERAAILVAGLESALEDANSAVVVLARDASVEHAGKGARELLTAYFPGWSSERATLPTEIGVWLASARGDEPLVALETDGPRGRLRVRLAHIQDPPLLVLEEQRPSPPSVEYLRARSLTRREAQTLRLLCAGKRNAEIAHELYISESTVRKHLEHVYAKLGVQSRAAAIAWALSTRAAH